MKDPNFIFKATFIAFLIFHTIVVLNINFFPFIDVPNHLAEGTIYRFYNDASNKFSKFYTLHYLFYPNTFFLFFYSLPIFSTVEIANSVLHLLLVITLPIFTLLVINQIKGNRWLAVASFILVYNYNMTYGFTGNAVALNAIILILFFWLKDLDVDKKFNYKIIVAVLLFSVYFLHAMVAMFCLLMCFIFIVWRYKNNLLKMALNMLYLLPATLMIIYWWAFLQKEVEKMAIYDTQGLSIKTFLTAYYSKEYFLSFSERGRFMLADNFQLFEGMTGFVVAFVFALIFIVPIFVWFLRVFKEKPSIKHMFSDIDEKYLYILLFVFVSAGCYFVLPSSIPGQAPIFERFSTIFLLALIFAGSVVIKENSKAFKVAVLILSFVHLGLWAQYFYQFDQENKDFASLLPEDKDKVVTMVAYDPDYRGRPVCRHFQNYHIVWNHGIATTKIIDFRFGMIRRKDGIELPYQAQVDLDQEDPGKMVAEADFVLGRGEIPAIHKHHFDDFKEVKTAGKWFILERQTKDLTVLQNIESKKVN